VPASAGDRVPATPLARRLAARHGLDVDGIAGTGPGGFVLRSDVLGAAGLPPAAPPAPASPAEVRPATGPGPGPGPRGVVTVVEPSRVQRVVAERMAESRATIPDFTMRVDVDRALAESAREQLLRLAGGAAAPSLNDMVVKAAALALREVPWANGRFREGRIEQYERVNVGIAVAAPDGLLVPVIRDADRRSLGDLAEESRRLAAAARAGAVAPEDLEGGTFTVSNLGMFGIRSFTAIINPPQAAILAVGMVRDEAVVRDGEIRPGRRMSLTLSGDHRILNGVDGARLLGAIRGRLEEPLRLALG
jgi:pyruvate dehydrogenase E2 component (dihydrolipoamide acetyltransferase)